MSPVVMIGYSFLVLENPDAEVLCNFTNAMDKQSSLSKQRNVVAERIFFS